MSRLVYWFVCILIFLACLLSAIFVPRALGQDASTGAIRGTVSDSTGSRIGGATLVFVSSTTGFRYSVVSDPEGHFAIDLLPPGQYDGRAVAPNMSPQVSPQLRVEVGGTVEIEFRLGVAGIKETVTVAGDPPVVDPQTSSVSAVVDEHDISELPLNGRRFTDLALLTPGVTQDPRGLTSASNGDLAFGGIRGYQSSYLVDGADNNNSFFGQARGRYRAPYQFSNEVVQEFRVSSNTYSPELGRAGTAVINVVTKSGTNHLHGSSFFYFRNSEMDAQHPFMNFKPPSNQEQFGFTVGGPIKRNRLFFFAGYDQHAFHIPAVVRFLDGSTVITPQAGAGPVTPGDYEPSDQALVFATAGQLSNLSGNYPAKLLGNAGFFKLDYSITPRNQLSARLSTSRYYGTNNVFFDPASPLTTYAISDNGEESVATESASLSLTSGLSSKITSHLRAQISRDLQQSSSNSDDPLTRIYSVTDGFGRSSILPRQTRERKMHLTETFSLEGGRNTWKFGGDALITQIYNYFPSLFGGEYFFDDIKVNPFTFEPQIGGLQLTPLRAFAHDVPRYYIQNFGSPVTHPDTNEYAWFLQDTARVTNHLALSMGVRYDLQTFATKDLVSNPLWPDSGKVPRQTNNFSPRVGLAYSLGNEHPLIIRAGYGLFYTRIPQIYTSSIESDNGLSGTHIFLNNTNSTDRQIFPQYPNPLVSCAITAASCIAPPEILSHVQSDISAFSSDFKTPRVEQASLTMEREMAHRFAVGVSYLYVHGEHLIRARDENLPPPTEVQYPVYDATGTNFLGTYYNVDSFSTWQMSRSFTCPFPPCINPLERPIPQLGAINVFESAASSVYHGLTVSIHRRMTNGIYFRLAYTYGKAIDDGQDALVAGKPATVQNSYATSDERGLSVVDQRNRLALSWVTIPRPFDREHARLGKIFNNWKLSGIVTYGSGRPVDARITGDANGDDNSGNDRLPGVRRNSFLGPDYATTDMRVTRRLLARDRLKLDLIVESFNLLNRDNQRVQITDNGFQNSAGNFVQSDNTIGIRTFPAEYRTTTNFLHATDAYAARQMEVALKLLF
ncbi:MAG TPA: carboxypeptidase regulatory-like domain-containing protein [Terriglobales bacterium]|nr:carboxypeptidase regulatory-like domain-containing protein [Terriglobales bacterium]